MAHPVKSRQRGTSVAAYAMTHRICPQPHEIAEGARRSVPMESGRSPRSYAGQGGSRNTWNQRRAITLRAELDRSIYVPDNSVWAVSAAGGFHVPLALVILVLDGFRVARDFLLRGGRPRSGERLGMGREGFRKYAVDFIGPAAVVPDNLVGDIRHDTPFEYAGGGILSDLEISGEPANLFVRPTTGCPPT